MYVSTHFVTGAAIGKMVGNNWIAFILGILSHIILDIIPHHDYRGKKGAFLDTLITGAMALWLFSSPSYVFWGAIGATIPDLEVIISYVFFKKKGPRFFPTHSGKFTHRAWKWPGGFVIQVGIMLGAVLFLLRTIPRFVG